MKQPLTVTKLLRKVDEMFSIMESLKKSLEHKNKAAFTVKFYHNNRILVATRWSDTYGTYPDDKSWTESYEYEITSRGIHFHSYSIKELDQVSWQSRDWYMSHGDEQNSIHFISIPNDGPPNQKLTMYSFHQEQIRQALSTLPAWAICVMND